MKENPERKSLSECINDVRAIADRITYFLTDGYDSEDVVSQLLEKLVRAGKSEAEIISELTKYSYRLVKQANNDINDRENAVSRGGQGSRRQEPSRSHNEESPESQANGYRRISFDDLESFYTPTYGIDQYFDTSQISLEDAIEEKEEAEMEKRRLDGLIEEAQLSSRQKAILKLVQRGFSAYEIAAELELDITIVRSRLAEAKSKLVQAYKNRIMNKKAES